MATARRLGARRLHYTAVSAAIRDTGRPGGGDWSVIYNCAAPERYPFVAGTDPRHGAARVPRPPRSLQGRAPRDRGRAAPAAPADHRRQHLAAARTSRSTSSDEIAPQIDGDARHLHRSGRRRAEADAARPGGGDADADRMGGAVSGRAARVDAVRHAADRVPPRRRARRASITGAPDSCATRVDEMAALVGRLAQIDRAAVRAEADAPLQRRRDRRPSTKRLYREMAAA